MRKWVNHRCRMDFKVIRWLIHGDSDYVRFSPFERMATRNCSSSVLSRDFVLQEDVVEQLDTISMRDDIVSESSELDQLHEQHEHRVSSVENCK